MNMSKNFLKIGLVLFVSIGVISYFSSCSKEAVDNFFNGLDAVLGEDGEVESLFGWQEEDENMDEIENDIILTTLGDGEVPTAVDLSPKFPPIGNQSAYGTCVAWALGYNLKTYLEAVDQAYTSSQLAQPDYQCSPKDLFLSIGANDKGEDCNGTGFEVAFDQMVSRGIATMSAVPYSGLGDCSQSPTTTGNTEAARHKIENYRKIGSEDNMSVTTLKSYLAQGRAIGIGARLGDDFMQWNSDDVISSDTYMDPGMQHAYHAMALCGYDDNKGPNGAFRVVNSWATSWGDNGYIWVDYDFFVNEFCFAAFVATNTKTNPDSDGDNIVDNDEIISGIDLVSWELYDEQDPDYSTDPYSRMITYNVYNIGNEEIKASEDWNIIYVYYNAYDADDFGILLYDYYSDDYGAYGEDGSLSISEGYGVAANWYNYINIPAGVSAAQALYGGEDSRYVWPYTMPSTNDAGDDLTGYYYLVLISDGFDVISENDESNNYYYLTDDVGDPLYFSNGVIQSTISSSKKKSSRKQAPVEGDDSPCPTARNERNVNSYTPAEISALLDHQKESGKLKEKVKKFVVEKKANSLKSED